MNININEEFILLIGWDRFQALKAGTAMLTVGVHEILYISDNGSKVDVIKDGTIKSVI